MNYVYDKEWCQEAYQAGTLLAEPAANYRISNSFILAFGFEKKRLGDYRTLVVDSKRGGLLLKKSTNSLITHLINEDVFGGKPLQKMISNLLEIKEQHVVSAGGGAIFSLNSVHASGTDLVALQKMDKVECDDQRLRFTELDSENCYLLDPPRSYAQSYKQIKESVIHNAMYLALFHRVNGSLSPEVWDRKASNLLYNSQCQEMVDKYVAGQGITLKNLMDKIECAKWIDFKKILLKDMKMPIQSLDLDYALEQSGRKQKIKM
ncbi:hypothetical protein [Lactobacillus sp.]|uniref:hypothetical protein n=1 Tax=Lactobacillus sp. TaxID=1591 RepID=UPI003EF95C00